MMTDGRWRRWHGTNAILREMTIVVPHVHIILTAAIPGGRMAFAAPNHAQGY